MKHILHEIILSSNRSDGVESGNGWEAAGRARVWFGGGGVDAMVKWGESCERGNLFVPV